MYTHGWFVSMYGKKHYNIGHLLFKKSAIVQCGCDIKFDIIQLNATESLDV